MPRGLSPKSCQVDNTNHHAFLLQGNVSGPALVRLYADNHSTSDSRWQGLLRAEEGVVSHHNLLWVKRFWHRASAPHYFHILSACLWGRFLSILAPRAVWKPWDRKSGRTRAAYGKSACRFGLTVTRETWGVCSRWEVPALLDGSHSEPERSAEKFSMLAGHPGGFKMSFYHFPMPFKARPESDGNLGKRLILTFKDSLWEEDGKPS